MNGPTLSGRETLYEDDAFGGEIDNTTAIFGKIGYRRDVLGFGAARFSFDIFRGRNDLDFALPEGALPEAVSSGSFAVRAVEPLGTKFYVGVLAARESDAQKAYTANDRLCGQSKNGAAGPGLISGEESALTYGF